MTVLEKAEKMVEAVNYRDIRQLGSSPSKYDSEARVTSREGLVHLGIRPPLLTLISEPVPKSPISSTHTGTPESRWSYAARRGTIEVNFNLRNS
jgi:hypothetical protein